MKKKFNLVNKFLRGYGLEKIEFSWSWYAYDVDEPEWDWYSSSLKYERKVDLPKNILFIITEILQPFWNKPLEGIRAETGTYRIDLEIYPNESKWVIIGLYEEDVTQEENHTIEITEENFNEYLDNKDIEFIKAEYDGGGDSGWIPTVFVDGKDLGDMNRVWQNPEYKLLVDELYNILERRVSGWEIDDGSNGNIEISKVKGQNAQVALEHSWFLREFRESNNDFILTNDTFDDEE